MNISAMPHNLKKTPRLGIPVRGSVPIRSGKSEKNQKKHGRTKLKSDKKRSYQELEENGIGLDIPIKLQTPLKLFKKI